MHGPDLPFTVVGHSGQPGARAPCCPGRRDVVTLARTPFGSNDHFVCEACGTRWRFATHRQSGRAERLRFNPAIGGWEPWPG